MNPTFPKFSKNSTSLAKKYCTEQRFLSLKDKRTEHNFTLLDALQSGLINPDSDIGMYAGDAQSYDLFSDIIHPIIHEYHGVSPFEMQVNDIRKVDRNDLVDTDKRILSCRVRAARNITDFPFTPNMNGGQRQDLEKIIADACSNLPGNLAGKYYSYNSLSHDEFSTLESEKLLFPRGDRFQDAAGINRDFPSGRGVFLSHDRQLRIWVNEEDHLRIICQSTTSTLSEVFNLFYSVHTILKETLSFSHHPQFGFLTSCPTNIGTSMRIGVHMRLNKLSNDEATLEKITSTHNLQIRGTGGEKTMVENNVYDISNRNRFGITEVGILQSVLHGIASILEAEKSL